jgi:ribose transport system ATP-binding protein
VLEATGIRKRFGHVIALENASLQVRRGEVHGLMGANGAGKSTFVKMLTGVLKPDAGTLKIEGRPYSVRSPAQAQRLGIVSLYQEPAIVPHLSISENIRLARVPAQRVADKLAAFRFGALDWRTRAADLPLPILRMVDVARALAADPKILILDEATAALSAELADMLFQEVHALRQSGRSVIYISHRMPEIEALCDRATVLRDGVVAGVVDARHESGSKIVSLMLGERAGNVAFLKPGSRPRKVTGAPLLSVRELTVEHRLSDVSFDLRRGEVLGVAALEGQGQEELFECLSGLRRPDAGTITLKGQPVTFRHPADAIDAGVALVPAERSKALLAQRSVKENIWLPWVSRVTAWGAIPVTAEREAVTDAIKALSIDIRAESEVRQLSGGNQQKVVVGRWLAHGFDVLLCFDPTRGIDVGAKAQIFDLVRTICQRGATVLYFTSDLLEIQRICDRALVLFGGQLTEEITRERADEPTLLRAVHGLAVSRDTSYREDVRQ